MSDCIREIAYTVKIDIIVESEHIWEVYQSMEVIIIESIFALIAVGTVGFWLFWGLVLFGMVWLTEAEHTISTVFAGIGVALFLWLAYDFNVVLYALTHKVNAAIAIVGYFFIGMIWLLAKWGFYVQSLMDRALEHFNIPKEAEVWKNVDVARTQYGSVQFRSVISGYADTKMNPADLALVKAGDPLYQEAKRAWVNRFLGDKGIEFPPLLSQHKAKAIYWVGSWPFSLLWFLLNKPVKYISTFIVNRVGKLTANITNWVIAVNLR